MGRICPLEPEGNIVDKFTKNAIVWEKKFKLKSEKRKKIITRNKRGKKTENEDLVDPVKI